MKIFFTSLLGKIAAQKIPAILVSIGSILSGVSLWYRAYFAKYLADPTGELALLTTTISVVCILLLWATYFWFKPKFVFNKHLQIYIDIKTEIPYCPSCKDGYNRSAKLIEQKYGWKCCVKECAMPYTDPDNPKPKPSVYIPD